MGYNGGEKRKIPCWAQNGVSHQTCVESPRRDFFFFFVTEDLVALYAAWRKGTFDSCVYLTFRTYHLTTFVYNKRVPFHFHPTLSINQSTFRKCKHNLLLLCSIQHGSGLLVAY